MHLRIVLISSALLSLLTAIIAGTLYYMALRDIAIREFGQEAEFAVARLESIVSQQIERGLKPVLALASLPEMRQQLRSSSDDTLHQVNAALDRFCAVFEASDCYLMNTSGLTVASSNRHNPKSFVGKNFAFRPYFTQAMDGIPSVYAALGVISKKRGLYFSAPVHNEDDSQVVGVAVTKILVDALEQQLDSPGIQSALIDPQGVVFMSSEPGWLFHTIPIGADKSDVTAMAGDDRQFGAGDSTVSGFSFGADDTAIDQQRREFSIAQAGIKQLPGWRVLVFKDRQDIQTRLFGHISGGALVGFIILLLVITFVAAALYRNGTRDITRRRLAEMELKQSEDRLRHWNLELARLAKHPSIVLGDLEATLPLLTESMAKHLGVARASIWWLDEQLIHLTLADLYESGKADHSTGIQLDADAFPAYFAALRENRVISADDAVNHPATREFAKSYLNPLGITSMLDGMVMVSGKPVAVLCCEHTGSQRQWGADEQSLIHMLAGFVAVAIQARERSEAEHQMSRSSRALEQTADVVIITDRHGHIEYVNPTFEKVTGYQAAEVLGKNPSMLKSGHHDEAFYHKLWGTITSGKVFRSIVVNNRRDGSQYHEEITITPVTGEDGAITGFVSTGKDITDRIEDQERVSYLAHYDVLTDLPNRILLKERLDHALGQARREKTTLALLFMDLDQFKNINDTLGHDVGDKLLQKIAKRLAACLREIDTAARLGGDEFMVLIEHCDENEAATTAERVIKAIQQPVKVDAHEMSISTSIGISLYPQDGEDGATLTKHADVAMYRAKQAGRNRFEFYTREMGKLIAERISLENQLRPALEREEFFLQYQPLIDLESGRCIGFESLLRWQHPQQGVVPPVKFIPVLEETGMIIAVGEWILATACKHMCELQKLAAGELKMSVNISAVQFREASFAQSVFDVLSQTGLPAEALQIEVTESIAMDGQPNVAENLKLLSEAGIALAVDDFGTGFSSLSYLKHLPISVIKLDRSFVKDVSHDEADASIVKSVVSMSHGLNMTTIAEGVENREQYDRLKELGCDAMQGYFISRPLSPDNAIRFLENASAVAS